MMAILLDSGTGKMLPLVKEDLVFALDGVLEAVYILIKAFPLELMQLLAELLVQKRSDDL